MSLQACLAWQRAGLVWISDSSQQDRFLSRGPFLPNLQPEALLNALVALPACSLPTHFAIYGLGFLFIMASTISENLLFSHTPYFLLSCQSFPCYQLMKSHHLPPSSAACISALALPQKWKHHLYGDPGKQVRTPRFIKLCSLNSSSSKSSWSPPVNRPDICRLQVFMFTHDALARPSSPDTHPLTEIAQDTSSCAPTEVASRHYLITGQDSKKAFSALHHRWSFLQDGRRAQTILSRRRQQTLPNTAAVPTRAPGTDTSAPHRKDKMRLLARFLHNIHPEPHQVLHKTNSSPGENRHKTAGNTRDRDETLRKEAKTHLRRHEKKKYQHWHLLMAQEAQGKGQATRQTHRYQVAQPDLKGQQQHWNSAGTNQTHTRTYTAAHVLEQDRRCCCSWSRWCNINGTWRATKCYTEQSFSCLNKLLPDLSSAHLHLKQQTEDADLTGAPSSHQFSRFQNINLFVSEKDKGGDAAGSNEWVGRTTRQAANRCCSQARSQRMNAEHRVLSEVVLTTTFCNTLCAKLTPWLRPPSTSAVQNEECKPLSFFNIYKKRRTCVYTHSCVSLTWYI